MKILLIATILALNACGTANQDTEETQSSICTSQEAKNDTERCEKIMSPYEEDGYLPSQTP